MGFFESTAFTTALRHTFTPCSAATLTPPSGPTSSIYVDLKDEYIEVNGMATTMPVAYAVTADVSAATTAYTITINSVTYKIMENKPDGRGVSALVLSRDAV